MGEITLLDASNAPGFMPDVDIVVEAKRTANQDGCAIIYAAMNFTREIAIIVAEKIKLVFSTLPFLFKRERDTVLLSVPEVSQSEAPC